MSKCVTENCLYEAINPGGFCAECWEIVHTDCEKCGGCYIPEQCRHRHCPLKKNADHIKYYDNDSRLKQYIIE